MPYETTALADRLGRLIERSGVLLGRMNDFVSFSLEVVRRPQSSSASPILLIFSGTLAQRARTRALAASDDDITAAIERAAAWQDAPIALSKGLDEIVDGSGARPVLGWPAAAAVRAGVPLADRRDPRARRATSAVVRARGGPHRAPVCTASGPGADYSVAASMSPARALTRRTPSDSIAGTGVVQAAGKHRELLRTHPAYKDVVTRGEAA